MYKCADLYMSLPTRHTLSQPRWILQTTCTQQSAWKSLSKIKRQRTCLPLRPMLPIALLLRLMQISSFPHADGVAL